MTHRNLFCRAAWLGSLCAALLANGTARAQFFPPNGNVQFNVQGAPGEEAPPGFWIGLSCDGDLGGTLRAQLGLAEDQGLLVLTVAKESPAEKAGFQEHDVLISAGGKPLKAVQDLVAAVQDAKENELTIDLFRGGKPESVQVTPAKRPDQPLASSPDQPGFFGGDPEQFRKMIEEWHKQLGGRRPRDFRMFVPRPGMMLPPGSPMVVPAPAPLPEDMTLSITKHGAEPAKIVVTQGDKTFEVAEDKLSDLPDEVRNHVEGFLGRNQFSISFNAQPVPGVPALPPQPAPARPGRPGLRRQGPAPEGVDRLDQLQQELRKLQQSVEELRKEQAPK